MTDEEKRNLEIDLRDIKWEMENRKQIMASEYEEYLQKKREIIKKLYNR